MKNTIPICLLFNCARE